MAGSQRNGFGRGLGRAVLATDDSGKRIL